MYNIIKLPRLTVIILAKELKDSNRPVPTYEVINLKTYDFDTKRINIDPELKDMLMHKQIFVDDMHIKFRFRSKFFAKRKFKKVKPEEVEKSGE